MPGISIGDLSLQPLHVVATHAGARVYARRVAALVDPGREDGVPMLALGVPRLGPSLVDLACQLRVVRALIDDELPETAACVRAQPHSASLAVPESSSGAHASRPANPPGMWCREARIVSS